MTPLACTALVALLALAGSPAGPPATRASAATPATADQRSPVVPPAADLLLRFYDVHDLSGLGPAPHEPAEHLALLVEVVRAHVEPPLAERHTLTVADEATLILNGTAAQHAWVQRFLALQRRSAGVFCDLQFRLLELPAGTGAELGLGAEPRLLDPAEVEALLRRLEGIPYDLSLAPRVLTSSFGRVQLAVTTEVPFVTEYREWTDVEPGGRTLVVPEIESVAEGQELHSVVVRLAEDLVLVDFELVLREVERPLAVVPTAFGDTCRPVVVERKLASEVLLADGATAAFPVLERAGREVVVLLELGLVSPVVEPAEPVDLGGPEGERRGR